MAKSPEGRRVEVLTAVGLMALGLGVCGWLFGDIDQQDGQSVSDSGGSWPDSVECMTALRGMPLDIQQAINPWDTFPDFETVGIDFASFGENQEGQPDFFLTHDGKFQIALVEAQMRDWTSGEMRILPVSFLGIREIKNGNCSPIKEMFLLASGPQLQVLPTGGIGLIEVYDQVDGIRINFDGEANWQISSERVPLLTLPRNDQGLPAAVLLIDENGGRHPLDTNGEDLRQFWLEAKKAVEKLLAAIDANPVEAAPGEEISPPPANTLEPAAGTSTPALATPRSDVLPQELLLTELASDRTTPEPTETLVSATAIIEPSPPPTPTAEARPTPVVLPPPEVPAGPCLQDNIHSGRFGDWQVSILPGTEECLSIIRLPQFEGPNIVVVEVSTKKEGKLEVWGDGTRTAMEIFEERLKAGEYGPLPPSWFEYRRPIGGQSPPNIFYVWMPKE